MNAIKERPMLFNAAMVRAILDGSKTQTRRVVKPHGWTIEQMSKYAYVNVLNSADASGLTCKQPTTTAHAGFKLSPDALTPAYFACPYGTVGDQLWGRETFQPTFSDDTERQETDYETGKGFAVTYPATDGIVEWIDGDDKITSRCTPSIFMPRWASRIQLEVISIRVERLNDISEEDARAEGVSPYGDCYCAPYHRLWESINGEESWAVNPWVWVIEFKRVKP